MSSSEQLKLDNNECQHPFDPQHSGLDLIAQAQINRYRTPVELEQRLAVRHRVSPEQVVVTAGADEALTRFARAFLNESSHVITTVPTFPMILRHARQATRLVTTYPWMGLEVFPCAQIIEQIQLNTAVIALATPNNPTGTAIDFQSIRRISEALPKGLIILDMVYSDFADIDLSVQVRQLPNVISIHSFSKSWGLAGLRIGYAIGNDALAVQRLRHVGSPYPVSTLSLEFVMTHFDELATFSNQYIQEIKKERHELYQILTQMGLKAWPSQANFVFCQPRSADVFFDKLQTAGVVCRLFTDLLPNLGAFVRLTCPGNQNDFKSLVERLQSLSQTLDHSN